MNSLWSAEERSAALSLSYREFAMLFPGRSASSWSNIRGQGRFHPVVESEAAGEAFDPEVIEVAAREAARNAAAAELRRRIDARKLKLIDSEVSREIAAKVTEQARHEEIIRLIETGMARMPAFAVPIAPEPAQDDVTPETMVLLLSDIHIGKLVQPEVVGPEFGYNVSVFEERLARLKDRLLRLKSLHCVDRLVIYFLGDGVDGVDMRRGHAHRVDVQTATQQTIMLATAMARLFADLATVFPTVHVQWHFGNHGRIGDFGVNLPSDNHDWMAGTFVQTILDSAPNITIAVPTQKYSLTQLGPLTVYAAHGDGIKGGGGFAGLPAYGIARSVAKEIGLHKQVIDLAVIGHFHTANDLTFGATRVLMNGDWSGGDDYSVNALGLASEPEQWVFGCHKRRGITWQYRVQLAATPRRATKVAA
jgi:hypothetical protein